MTTTNKALATGLGAAALCALALPAAAASFTQPGGTTGSPNGAVPPPGLYFVNAANWGLGSSLPSLAGTGDTTAIGVEVPVFIWVPGWNFLGGQYAAAVAFPLVEVGVRAPGAGAGSIYLRDGDSPAVNPVTLSWNLGNGFFASFGEFIYIPIDSPVTVSTTPGFASPASFEQRVSASYIANDWVASANAIVGIVTTDGAGVKGPDYINVDLTLAHNFGKWQLGVVGYYAADFETTPINAAVGRGEEFGVGGLVGYNFGSLDLQLRATHQFITKGVTDYGKDDTRVWTVVVIPIWNPSPPAPPQSVVTKY